MRQIFSHFGRLRGPHVQEQDSETKEEEMRGDAFSKWLRRRIHETKRGAKHQEKLDRIEGVPGGYTDHYQNFQRLWAAHNELSGVLTTYLQWKGWKK
jgi:dTDP-4-dehydrorhamnose 3,5-epimerase-like enzyme